MAATDMTAEFGTIHFYSNLGEYSEAQVVQFFGQILWLIENYVNCDILV